MSDSHDHDLAGAYVLDALEPEEHVAFEAHLQTCAACREEVAQLRQVVDVLPLAVEPLEPPPDLRDRILAELDSPRQQLTVMPGGTPARAAGAAPRRSWFLEHTAPLATAAALLVASLAGWNVYLQTHNGSSATDTVTALVADAQKSGATVYPVGATAIDPAASAVLVQPRGATPAYAIIRGLSAPPKNKVYEVWFMHGTRPTSEAVFIPSGSGAQIIHLATPTAGYDLSAVTVEPAPHGSSAPTTPFLLAGKLSA